MVNSLIRKKSEIHGFGIFANKKIDKGKIFYEVPLESISNKPKSKHAFIGNNKWVNDPKILNKVNHSCDSNTRLNISKEKPVLIAKKNINIGEEITCNYNETEKGGSKVPCNCRTKKCLGYFIRIE
jgi:hypothetical protein